MFFSGSGKNGLKTGANWGSTILFDPHSDESRGTVHKINDDSLIEDMSDLIDASEMIKRIWVYKHPLFPWQFTQLFLCHQFVLIETNTWWWSIEKTASISSFKEANNYHRLGILRIEEKEQLH